MHACIFCDAEAETLPLLVAHVLYQHRGEHRLFVAGEKWEMRRKGEFSFKKHWMLGNELDCFCGSTFFFNLREIAPAFRYWAEAWREMQDNPWHKHLASCGGLVNHLEQESYKAMLVKIEQFGNSVKHAAEMK